MTQQGLFRRLDRLSERQDLQGALEPTPLVELDALPTGEIAGAVHEVVNAVGERTSLEVNTEYVLSKLTVANSSALRSSAQLAWSVNQANPVTDIQIHNKVVMVKWKVR